jgi:hypothetical protein
MATRKRAGSGSTSPVAIERAELERRAIELRRDGRTYDEIAESVGYRTRSAAYKAVRRGLARWMREADGDFRTIELARTEVIIARLMPLVDADPPDLKAIDTLMRVMDYRARITGLYAPQQHQVGVEVHAHMDVVRKVEAYEQWKATVAQAREAQLALPAIPLPSNPTDPDDKTPPEAERNDYGNAS